MESSKKKAEKFPKWLAKLIKAVPVSRRPAAEALALELEFMLNVLDNLRGKIAENYEVIEDFVQGTQSIKRISPEAQSYLQYEKSFTTTLAKLIALMPEAEQKQQKDEFDEFVKSRGMPLIKLPKKSG